MQMPVDNLNFFNDTVPIIVCVCFATKHGVLFNKAVVLYTGSAHREEKSRVCSQYTRQDCPVGLTDTIVQYYKILYRKKELTRRDADVWAAWCRCMDGVVQMYGWRGADVWASWCRCMGVVVQMYERGGAVVRDEFQLHRYGCHGFLVLKTLPH